MTSLPDFTDTFFPYDKVPAINHQAMAWPAREPPSEDDVTFDGSRTGVTKMGVKSLAELARYIRA